MTTTGAEQTAFSVLAFLAESSVRTLGFAALAGLAAVAFLGRRAALQLWLWTVVLVAALAIPVLDRVLPRIGVPVPGGTDFLWHSAPAPTSPIATSERLVSGTAGVLATTAGTMAIPAPDVASNAATLEPVIVALALYLLGVACLLLRAAVGWTFTRRLETESSPIGDAHMLARLAHHAAAAGLKRLPLLTESPRLLVPVTTSVLRPIIVVPQSWREWDPAKIDAVLVHELAHISRRDTLTQRLSLIYRAAFWPNPFSWWMHHRLAVLAERVSDEAALAAGIDPAMYAETLVGFFAEQHRDGGRRAVWHLAMARGASGSAEKRVERVLAWERGRSFRLTKTAIVGVVLAAAPVMVLTASVGPEPIAAAVIALPAAPRGVPLPPPRTSTPAAELPPATPPKSEPGLTAAGAKIDLQADRAWVLFFDLGGMQPTDVRRTIEAASHWLDETMSDRDIAAVTSAGRSRLDFTHSKSALHRGLDRLESEYSGGNARAADTAAGLQRVKAMCDSLGAISQSKTLLVFGAATGLAAPGPVSDRQPVVDACGRTTTNVYTVDGGTMAPWQQIYRPGNGLTNPRPIKHVDPKYTNEARLGGIQGDVELDIVVLADGTVGDVRVTKSLEAGLDAQAIVAAKQWLFQPAMKGGSPVAMIVGLSMEFKLHEEPPAAPPVTPGMKNGHAQGIVPPKAIERVSPKYTSEAMRAKIQGDVEVEVIVQKDGAVGDVRVTKSLDPDLDEAAIAAARQWRFQPATKDGQPVEYTCTLSLEFRIHGAPPPPARIDAYAPDTPGLVGPTIAKRVDPKYTSDAMRAKIQGTVELDVLVQADGSIGEIRVTKSLDTQFGLDQEALAAVKQFTFTPATLNGDLVPAMAKVMLEFRLH